MSDVTSEQIIEASPEQVWAILGDEYHLLHEWFDGASGTELETDLPHGPASVRIVRNGPMKVRETIDVWEPGRRLGYVIAGLGPGAADVRSDWELHDRPDGTTIAKVTTSWRMRGGPVGTLIRPIYAQALARAGRKLTVGLKEAVEARAS